MKPARRLKSGLPSGSAWEIEVPLRSILLATPKTAFCEPINYAPYIIFKDDVSIKALKIGRRPARRGSGDGMGRPI